MLLRCSIARPRDPKSSTSHISEDICLVLGQSLLISIRRFQDPLLGTRAPKGKHSIPKTDFLAWFHLLAPTRKKKRQELKGGGGASKVRVFLVPMVGADLCAAFCLFKWVKWWDPSQGLLKPPWWGASLRTPQPILTMPQDSWPGFSPVLLVCLYLLSLQLHQPLFCFLFLEWTKSFKSWFSYLQSINEKRCLPYE